MKKLTKKQTTTIIASSVVGAVIVGLGVVTGINIKKSADLAKQVADLTTQLQNVPTPVGLTDNLNGLFKESVDAFNIVNDMVKSGALNEPIAFGARFYF